MTSVFETKKVRLPKPKYTYVTTEEDAKTVMSLLDRYSAYSLDTETTGLDPFTSKISLVQIGVPNNYFVFDVRSDTEHSSVGLDTLEPILTSDKHTKILQNAAFDMKQIKTSAGYYLNNVYDTMLVEQMLNLGRYTKAGLDALVLRYLGVNMDKEPRGTFQEYGQKFEPYQLEYAANDVVVLDMIREMQWPKIQQEGLENVSELEFNFLKPMCEMELNGITLDVPKWRAIMSDIDDDRREAGKAVADTLTAAEDQLTMFGVSAVNIDSPSQLMKSLKKYGLELESTSEAELKRYKGIPVIDALLDYRKANKLISTYAEPLIEKINKVTKRLHTDFRQMVSTGRMSSSNPNLQNIPKKQKFRSCFIAKEGYVLITSDMSGAELRILGNLAKDPIFIDSYANGIDLHTKTASGVFNVPMEEVTKEQRGAAKAVGFGIVYGMSKYGLAKRLKISEPAAQKIINGYLNTYKHVKRFLTESGRNALRNRYSRSISGRKRYYNLPDYGHPDYNKIKGSVERRGKNAPIQGSNADTIKESMNLVVERLERSGLDAKLLLTVHDEIIVEAREDIKHEVRAIVEQSLIDGFGKYFDLIPMETDALIGDCWLKDSCSHKINGVECNHSEMGSISDEKYGTRTVCKKCGGLQD